MGLAVIEDSYGIRYPKSTRDLTIFLEKI
jgi:hypothetical protein